jgi:hypothetical protein
MGIYIYLVFGLLEAGRMNDWREDSNCSKLAPEFEVPKEEWTEVKTEGEEKATDEERVQRSIWYYFFEGYESDTKLARIVDEICKECPVIKECFEYGTTTGQTGVHGGIYLNRGNIDHIRNAHKTEEDWAELMEKVQ